MGQARGGGEGGAVSLCGDHVIDGSVAWPANSFASLTQIRCSDDDRSETATQCVLKPLHCSGESFATVVCDD